MAAVRRWWYGESVDQEDMQELSEMDMRDMEEEEARKALEKIQAYVDRLGVLNALSQSTGIPNSFLLFGTVFLACILFFKAVGGLTFVFVVGLLYPGFMSFRVVEQKNNSRHEVKWLMYWVVFSFVHLCETVAYPFVSSESVATYTFMKLLFLLWLFLPMTQGSQAVYELVIQPFLKKHEERIDRGIQHARTVSENAIKDNVKIVTASEGCQAKSFYETVGSPTTKQATEEE